MGLGSAVTFCRVPTDQVKSGKWPQIPYMENHGILKIKYSQITQIVFLVNMIILINRTELSQKLYIYIQKSSCPPKHIQAGLD